MTVVYAQIIVKPASIFGHEDRLLNWIADFSKKTRMFPLLEEGRALTQPVHVNDVAKAIMDILYVRSDIYSRALCLLVN